MTASEYRPCVVVPVYNHPEGIAEVCARLASHRIPCLLVDDGSGEPCRSVLDELQATHDWVSLIRFPDNRGKGAAVSSGLLQAKEQGYTHALQVDADGQHDLADLPRFIQCSRRSPQAVVTGARVADGISATRHYGRKLTDWLVWAETLSLTIQDSMCGYRMYPLAAAVPLLERHRVGQRMDFDTDILVRLYWRGLEVEQVTTKVIYRDAIPSHFRMFRDNVRMTVMHVRLLLGMLPRAPRLLWRNIQSRG